MIRAIQRTPDKAQVKAILAHPHEYAWTMQEIGLLGLRLDNRRECRLHVWDPSRCVGDPPVHDHPYDFTSTVIAGQITNTRFSEHADGTEYQRMRYTLGDEATRRTDTVRLTTSSTAHEEGESYAQLAHELHDSRQLPGTVTVIRCTWRDVAELSVCAREEAPWVSGRSRAATPAEVQQIASQALEWF